MLLLVDAGNTRIKWAALASDQPAAPGQWAQFGMVARAEIGALVQAWQTLGISRVLLSNVAGAALREELEQVLAQALAQTLAQTLGFTPVPRLWFKSQAELGGVRNAYRDPQQLGCDRFASAIGARALYPGQALMIVTCGTATTIDCVSAEGVFTGGMILPGLSTMAASLATNTAQLPQVPHAVEIAQAFADNTTDAIISGCLNAQAGAIERALSLYHARHPDARCLMSGGAAHLIAPHLSIPHDKVDNLVLIGLQTFAFLPE